MRRLEAEMDATDAADEAQNPNPAASDMANTVPNTAVAIAAAHGGADGPVGDTTKRARAGVDTIQEQRPAKRLRTLEDIKRRARRTVIRLASAANRSHWQSLVELAVI